MSENIGGGRPVRDCDLCGQQDDHPRHMVAVAVGEDAEFEQIRHLDCCAAAGCPDGSCERLLAGYEGSSGADLLHHLMEGARR